MDWLQEWEDIGGKLYNINADGSRSELEQRNGQYGSYQMQVHMEGNVVATEEVFVPLGNAQQDGPKCPPGMKCEFDEKGNIRNAKPINDSNELDPRYKSHVALGWGVMEAGATAAAGEIGGALLVRGVVWGIRTYRAAQAVKKTTTVFRAVDAAEAASINSTGKFLLKQGGTEVKYFAKSPRGCTLVRPKALPQWIFNYSRDCKRPC